MMKQWPKMLLCLCAVALLSGCASSQLERNKQVVLANARAYNEHDVAGLRATMAPDLRRRCEATPDIQVRSVEDFIFFAKREWVTFPDGTLTVERLVAEGDRVGVFGRFSGTQQGPMGPFPVSGKRMENDFCGVFRIEAGRIAEIMITWDNLSALRQLGHWSPDEEQSMQIHYLEIVSPDVEQTCEALASAHGVFSAPVPELGNARTAAIAGGGRIGVRGPLRESEASVVRPYVLVDDLDAAVAAAKAAGAEIALPRMEIPGQGTIAIYVLGGIEHGFWQR
ncbi:MAG: ester cyclase [Phycisphaerales bacterium]|nr:ester cyclase [Phycisphaerales bacterium]